MATKYYKASELAKLVGVDSSTVLYWIREFDLPAKKLTNKRLTSYYKISEFEFKRWAIANSNLIRIKQSVRSRFGIPPRITLESKPVRRVSDGKVYISLKEAAKDNWVVYQSISRAIAKEGTCVGSRWEFV